MRTSEKSLRICGLSRFYRARSHLYEFEYDFDAREGRIPNFRRPSAPPLLLRWLLGNDWLSTPVYVQFTGDQVTDRDVAKMCESLGKLPTVRHLNLRGTLVCDESTSYLKDLPQLRVLDIRDSAYTPEGVMNLRSLLPACEILSNSRENVLQQGK